MRSSCGQAGRWSHKALRLTQAQIAGIIGEDQGDVSRLERGEIDPSTARANRIRGINISRFDARGRLAEEWAIWSVWLDESWFGPNP